jgi:hypothetical protein
LSKKSQDLIIKYVKLIKIYKQRREKWTS